MTRNHAPGPVGPMSPPDQGQRVGDLRKYAEAMAGVRKHPAIPKPGSQGVTQMTAQCVTCARRIVLCIPRRWDRAHYWRHLPWNIVLAFRRTFADEIVDPQLDLGLDNGNGKEDNPGTVK